MIFSSNQPPSAFLHFPHVWWYLTERHVFIYKLKGLSQQKNVLLSQSLYDHELKFKHVLLMSVLYVTTLYLRYKPLKFGIISYTTVAFFCWFYCISSVHLEAKLLRGKIR